ncbi:MAG TPA: YozQ family protein [Anoxybacillus sp.]|jgi:hypothetical protein|nr:YozQ family protein [Anoxybacillus sp.]
MENNNNHDENLKIAGKHYDPSDYKSNSALSSGLAVTHEQVSDTYVEGTVDAVIDDLNGKDVKIPQEGNKNE